MHKVETLSKPNPAGQPDGSAAATSGPQVGSKEFRLLKWNELVSRGDFVVNEQQGFEPWTGPAGFRADSFVKAIYRRLGRRATRTKPAI